MSLSPSEEGAALRVAEALSSASARRRRWALDRLRAGLDETEGPALAPRRPYPDALRAALAARLAALAEEAAKTPALPDDEEEDDDLPLGEDGSRAVSEEAGSLLLACSDGGVREAVPAIERLLASATAPGIELMTWGSHALARLGARGQGPADAVRAGLARLVAGVEERAGRVQGGGGDRLAAQLTKLRKSLEMGLLPALLPIEGARHVPAALAAVVDALTAVEERADDVSFESFAPLIDGLHDAARLRGAVGAIALMLDAGEAPKELARAVPPDALLHARKRSTPKLVKVAVHALRPLVAAGGPAAPGAEEGLGPDDPLAGARAIAREALRLRDGIEALRGDRAKLLAVLLLAARAKLLGALPASIDEAVQAQRPELSSTEARAGDRAESPAEVRQHVAKALEEILDEDRGFGPTDADARRVVIALGDAALPVLLERLDTELGRAPLGAATLDAGEVLNLIARLGTRAAADALLARFAALWRTDRSALLEASVTLADGRFLAPIATEHRAGEHAIERAALTLADVSGGDHASLAALRAAYALHVAAREETGAFPGSTGAVLAALREGEPASLDLDLACEECGRTYTYPVEQGLLVTDHEAAKEPRRARPAGGLKRVRLPDRPSRDMLVVLDEVECKGCGARDRARATEDALVTAEHLLSAIQEEIHDDGDLADVDPDGCPVREGHAADLLSEEEWPLDAPLDPAKLRAKFRERLAAFRADKEGDSGARWPPELDDAWPGEA